MTKYWILAAVPALLGSCDGASEIFGNVVQPEHESAFAQSNAASPKLNMVVPAPSSHKEQMFYNLSDDPESPQLLALDTIAGSGANTSVLILDLFKGEQKFGFLNTWHIDCVRSRMSITRAMMFQPGKGNLDKPIKAEVIDTQSSPKSRLIAELVCKGKGHLEKDRVYRDTLPEIIARFWG